MDNTKDYIAPDVDYIAFELTEDITDVIVSAGEDPTHDAIIDWS